MQSETKYKLEFKKTNHSHSLNEKIISNTTFAVFNAAPYPVEIPHPRRHTFSRGALSAT